MIKSYQRLTEFFQDIQKRKVALSDKKNLLIGQRAQLRSVWEEAVFSNPEEAETARKDMLDLESSIAELDDHIRVLERGVKTSSKVNELSQAVREECKNTLAGMKRGYTAQVGKVKKAQSIYLKELAILGELNNKSSKISWIASEANQYLPEKIHVGMNIANLNEVAISEVLIKKVYQTGKI